jgi:hypothetical protein
MDPFLLTGGTMSKEPGPREKALREMREARFAENAKIATGIRRAAAEGKAVLEQRVKATADRMKNKPRKKAKKK